MAPLDDDFTNTMFSSGSKAVPAPEAPAHYLVIVAGAEPGKFIEVSEEAVTIGRDPKQFLVFADTELSRRHAQVFLRDGALVAEDLHSTNGTFLDGTRITTQVQLREGSVIRVGRQFLKYERRNRRDMERTQELGRDLLKANSYVLSLLPAPVAAGPVRVDWRFAPSTQLGGDAFGYEWLTPDTFAVYLIDVSGHGVGAAMHSVTVMNVLRQHALPQTDLSDPAAVLAALNDMFQMDSHDGMYFTMWYGVYRLRERTLTYSAAGHHASYLVPADRSSAEPLAVRELMIGAVPGTAYPVAQTRVPQDSTLYLFSDGVFEIVTKDGRQWSLKDFVPLLLQPATAGRSEPDRLFALVGDQLGGRQLDDDFSLVALVFE